MIHHKWICSNLRRRVQRQILVIAGQHIYSVRKLVGQIRPMYISLMLPLTVSQIILQILHRHALIRNGLGFRGHHHIALAEIVLRHGDGGRLRVLTAVIRITERNHRRRRVYHYGLRNVGRHLIAGTVRVSHDHNIIPVIRQCKSCFILPRRAGQIPCDSLLQSRSPVL